MTTGVLSWEEMKKAILLNTGFFETSHYTEDEQMYITSGNWDNAGLSIGTLQYNYGAADRASELFTYMLNNHDSVVQAVFGTYTTEYATFKNVNLTYTRTQKVTWADGISDWAGNSGHSLLPPWKDILGRLAQTPECKAKYYDMFEAYYLGLPLDLFKQLTCTSRSAFASLFDCYNNRGRYYPIATIQWEFEQIDADTTLTADQKEAKKIATINSRGNDPTDAINVTTWTERRNCMRDEGGTYFGALYDPDTQFDINHEPAIPDKIAGLGQVVQIGEITASNIMIGGQAVKSLYLGANLIGSSELEVYTTSKVPDTQVRTNPNSYAGYESGASFSLDQGSKAWIDVQNFVACRCYYTLDGTTPTANSPRYTDGIVFPTAGTITLKTLAISLSGIKEAVKTFTVTVATAPYTTISPTTLVQNNIPITVTLTNSGEAGATIKYKLGTSATEYTYTGPFTVNQNSAGVSSTQIKITYWGVGATKTETAKTITYDTSGAVPTAPVVTATAGAGQVALSWPATANTTSYTVYRSTVAGQLGSIVSQYQAGTTYTNTGLTGGTTYYYTVQAGNYGKSTNSAQVSAVPTAGPTGWRYVKFEGHGDQTGVTTRLVEIQALQGATNRLLNLLPLAGYAAPNGGTIEVATDGAKVQASGYPLWWTAEGVPVLTYDLGAIYPIDTINVTGFSSTTDPRATQFIVWVSKDNTTWTQVTDYSGNTTNQPVDGFNFPVPAG
jgi:hypothetical protein